MIACGSRPYHPASVDFNHPRIYDSDSILELSHEPRHVIIYGAGVIGCEYASIFRGLNVKVDLINTRDRLLAFLDQEMSDSLSYHFWNNGVVIRHNEEFEKIEGTEDGVIVHLKSGKKVKADCLLYANGRTGNTDSLGLENVGTESDSRGLLKVNSMYQTALSHIYAVGDVIGYPSGFRRLRSGPHRRAGDRFRRSQRSQSKISRPASTPFRKSAPSAKPSRN